MSIDDARNALHAAMIESPEHPGWEAAKRQEAEDLAGRRAALEEREACESVEAEESHWVGVMAQMPEYVRNCVYAGGPG